MTVVTEIAHLRIHFGFRLFQVFPVFTIPLKNVLGGIFENSIGGPKDRAFI